MACVYPITSNTAFFPRSLIVNGNPAIVWHDDTDDVIYFLRSDDSDGDSWGTPVPIIAVGATSISGIGFALIQNTPAITFGFGTTVYYVKSSDINGVSWGSAITVDTGESLGFMGMELTTAHSGTAWPLALWYNFSNGLKSERSNATSGVFWTLPGQPLNPIPSSGGQRISTANINGAIGVVSTDSFGNLSYISGGGTSWTAPVSVDANTNRTFGSLALVNGRPAVAYYDSFSDNLIYKRADDASGTSWTAPEIIVDSAGDVGSWGSMEIVNGFPAIAYRDETNSIVKYIRSDDINGNGWTNTPASLFSFAGNQDCTLIVANGLPAIVARGTDLSYQQADDVDGDFWEICSSSSQSNSSSSTSSDSSSSTSLSSMSSESSSSSFPITFTEQLNQIIAGNNPENLILFTYTPDDGFEYTNDDQEIVFSFRTVNNEFFNYDSLLNPTAVEESSEVDCYVPEDDDVNIKHEPIFYVDLIVKNGGVKSTSVRAQEEKYKEEKVKYSFIIPKFTWNQDVITDAIASNVAYTPLADATGSFWAGTEDDMLYKIEYNSNVAASAYSTAEEGQIKKLIVNPKGQQMYVTTDEKLKKYTIDQYADGTEIQLFVTENTSVDNETKIMTQFDTEILTALPELGSIQELDENTLLELTNVDGFDAPFKIIKSTYHNAYFIAGTNILWKYDGTSKAIYSIEGYSISDFDVSDNGQIMIALNSPDDSYMRVLDRNFFRLLMNVRLTNGQARFCKFCSNKLFYGLSEIDIGGDQFVVRHDVFNTLNGDYSTSQSPNTLFTPIVEETTTPATQPVEIESPNGGESLEIGGSFEILWKSTKSTSDFVKIDLYKEGVYLRTIVASTPNTGIYDWTIPATLEIASDYTIYMEWLAAEVNPDNTDESDASFNMVDVIPSSSETEIEFFGSIGVDYDELNNQMVIVLSSGLVGFLNLEDESFLGWIDSGVTNYTAMVVKNENVKEIGTVTKVRIFVGSKLHLSDKWDSGVIETDLNSIFYGGGDNLVPGETYYVNIQVYSEDSGWSEVQSKKWIMPKK